MQTIVFFMRRCSSANAMRRRKHRVNCNNKQLGNFFNVFGSSTVYSLFNPEQLQRCRNDATVQLQFGIIADGSLAFAIASSWKHSAGPPQHRQYHSQRIPVPAISLNCWTDHHRLSVFPRINGRI